MNNEKYHMKIDKSFNKNIVKGDTRRMDFVFSHKSMQFVLSCGVIMARIDTEIDNLASLYWHFKRTKNVEDFIEDVKKYPELKKISFITRELKGGEPTRLDYEFFKK